MFVYVEETHTIETLLNPKQMTLLINNLLYDRIEMTRLIHTTLSQRHAHGDTHTQTEREREKTITKIKNRLRRRLLFVIKSKQNSRMELGRDVLPV